MPADAKDVILSIACGVLLVLATPSFAQSQGEPANYFDDPFIQVSGAIKDCPVPEGPIITQAEMRAEAHVRTERGT